MNSRSERRGSVLVQAALLIFAMMAVAAIVVDLGIVRATQGSMVVAADAACLEGLRGRDVLGVPGIASDLARRTSASRFAAGVFDADFDPMTANTDLALGAGPQIETGVAGLSNPAGGLLTTNGTYLPVLQLNEGANEAHGDMVAGTFTQNPGSADWHAESSVYSRQDFLPLAAGSAPGASAFLVRLRRSNDSEGLDQLPGVSSSGPTLPFLFGLGTPLGAADPR